MQEELNNILLFLKNIQDNNDLGNDNNKIKYLYNELIKIQNNIPSEESLEEIQRLKTDLEIKYDCLNELSYYFNPLYVTMKKAIHKKYIDKLRNKNKKVKINK